MMKRNRSRLAALCVALALMTACHTPPNLTPEAVVAFHNTRVIKGLDLIRDTAIAANAQNPPLVSTATTRKVVLFHRSALDTIYAGPGWQPKVLTALDETVRDLPSAESRLVAPYVVLVKTIIQEVTP
jgi:hypothetical protein